MKKGLSLLLAAMLVWAVAVPAFAAGNPFADVPADHWAYDSIVELAAAGLVEGYPDGTFGGSRNFTRYEMAMVFARTLGRIEGHIDTSVDAKVSDAYDKVAEELASKLSMTRDELASLIEAAIEKKASELPEKVVERVVVEKPAEKVVERVVEKPQIVEKVVVEKPVQTTIQKTVQMPFQMTEEAKAVLADFVAESVADRVANLKPELVAELAAALKPENTFTRDEINELIALATVLELELGFLGDDVEALAGSVEENKAGVAGNAEAIAKVEKKFDTKDMFAAEERKRLSYLLAGVQGDVDTVKTDVETLKEVLGGDIELVKAALTGDVAAVKTEMSAKITALETEIANLASEFQTELAVLGVRVSQLEYVFEKLETRVDKLEVAQKATADELAAFKAEQEKVKISGSTETVFKSVTTATEGTWGSDDIWKDPRVEDSNDDDEVDGDDRYANASDLKQKFGLTLTAAPADGVTVTAGLDATTDFFLVGDSDSDDFNLELGGVELLVTTDKVLRTFFAGEKSDEDAIARFHGWSIHKDKVEGDDEEVEVVAANFVNGKLDSEITTYKLAVGSFVTAIDQIYPVNDMLTLQGEAVLNWGYSVDTDMTLLASAYGKTILDLDYDLDLATTNEDVAQNGAWALDLTKATDFATLKFKYAAIGAGFTPEFGKATADSKRLDLKALDMELASVALTAEYVSKETVGVDFSAWKLTASKDVEFVLPLTLSGVMASDGDITNSKFSVDLVDYAMNEKFTLNAGYDWENNLIDEDWDADEYTNDDKRGFDIAADFALTDNMTVNGGYEWSKKRVNADTGAFGDPTTKTTFGAEYTLTVMSADVTAGYQYAVKNDDKDARNTYSVAVTSPFFGATLTTEGKLMTGYNYDREINTTDKVASFELAYPVVDDINLTFGGKYINSVDALDNSYTVKLLDGGVKFSF